MAIGPEVHSRPLQPQHLALLRSQPPTMDITLITRHRLRQVLPPPALPQWDQSVREQVLLRRQATGLLVSPWETGLGVRSRRRPDLPLLPVHRARVHSLNPMAIVLADRGGHRVGPPLRQVPRAQAHSLNPMVIVLGGRGRHQLPLAQVPSPNPTVIVPGIRGPRRAGPQLRQAHRVQAHSPNPTGIVLEVHSRTSITLARLPL